MAEGQERTFDTPDLGLAAFFRMKGLKGPAISRVKGRWNFSMKDPDGLGDELKREYLDSESYRHDNEVRAVKLMMRSEQRQPASGG